MDVPNPLDGFLKEDSDSARSTYIRFRDIVDTALAQVLLFGRLVEDCPKEWWYFRGSYIGSRLYLRHSLLSALRAHRLEAMVNLRFALDAGLSACFTANHLHFTPKGDESLKAIMNGNEKLKTRSFGWLNENHTALNKKMKEYRKLINDKMAHWDTPAFAIEHSRLPRDNLEGWTTNYTGTVASFLTLMFWETLSAIDTVKLAPDTPEKLSPLSRLGEAQRNALIEEVRVLEAQGERDSDQ